MKPNIEIVSTYPYFGDCPTHLLEIVKVCNEKECRSQKHICQKCEPIHSGHKAQKVEQYARQLTKKLVSMQPAEEEKRKNLVKPFSDLSKATRLFQAQLQQTSRILKEINMRQFLVFQKALRCDQAELYDYLCQLDLRKNGNAIEIAIQKLSEMNLKHAAAAKCYEKWVQDISNRMAKFMAKVEQLRDQALDISFPNFSQVLEDMKKEQKKNLEPIPKPEPKPDPKSDPKPVQIPLINVNLKQKDLIPQQIIQRVQQHRLDFIFSIDIDTNGMNSEGLQELLSPQKNYARLQKLIMSNNYMDIDCFETLIKANIPNLKVLNLENNFIEQDELFIVQIGKIKEKWPGLLFII